MSFRPLAGNGVGNKKIILYKDKGEIYRFRPLAGNGVGNLATALFKLAEISFTFSSPCGEWCWKS